MPLSVLQQLKSFKDLNKPTVASQTVAQATSVRSQLNTHSASTAPTRGVMAQVNDAQVSSRAAGTDAAPSVFQQLNRR